MGRCKGTQVAPDPSQILFHVLQSSCPGLPAHNGAAALSSQKDNPNATENSHQTKYFCWAVSALLGAVGVLQEQGRLVEAPDAPHGKDVLGSTSKGRAEGCSADGATQGANLILCGKQHPQGHREAGGWF